MSFAPEGYSTFIGLTIAAVVTFALALKLRSWPIWLTAFVLLLAALWIAWSHRSPALVTARAVDDIAVGVGAPLRVTT